MSYTIVAMPTSGVAKFEVAMLAGELIAQEKHVIELAGQ